jgi:peptidoglycan-associated lipoprotein
MHSRLAAAIFGLGIADVAYVDFILAPAVLAPTPRSEASKVGSAIAATPTLNVLPHLDTEQPNGPARVSDPPAVLDIAPEPQALAPAAQVPKDEPAVASPSLDSTDPIPEPTAPLAQREAAPPSPKVDAELPSPPTPDDVRAPALDAMPVAEGEWTVLFPVAGRAGLPEGASDMIKQAAERLRQDSRLRLRIVGHADERGTRAHNWQLGKQRAQALAHALQLAGVSPQQLEIQSEGEDEPAALGSMPEALARNRRAEMAIYAGRSQTP